MSDQTEVKGISEEERHANKVIYVGKQLYTLFVEVNRVLTDAVNHQGIAHDELGIFSEFEPLAYVAQARELGQVPVWNAESTPIGKKLTYPKGTTGVNA